MSDATCTEPSGCDRPIYNQTFGLCSMHYQRQRRGIPMNKPPKLKVVGTPRKRFLAKVNKRSGIIGARPELGECWTWLAWVDKRTGYGQFAIKQGNVVMAHRFGYELWVKPIPDGLEIDHLCRVRHCVRPDHLEPVTGGENQFRSPGSPAGINARKTHCKRGHPLSGDNLKIDVRGSRQCRTCMRLRKIGLRNLEDASQ